MIRRGFVGVLTAVVGLGSCSKDTEFSGGASDKNVYPTSRVELPGTEDVTIAESYVVEDGLTSLAFDVLGVSKVDGEKSIQPFTLYFVLDITNSMQTNIDAIKASIKQFASTVKAKGFELSVGVVAFRDELADTFPKSSDLDAFVAFIDKILASGGDDIPEAGMVALDKVADQILADTSSDVQAILAITDATSHVGAPAPRNCDINGFVSKMNGASSDLQQRLKFFYSVSEKIDGPCGTYTTPKMQYDDILSKLLPSVEPAKRGAALEYPFSSDVFLGKFVTEIEKTSNGVGLMCLPKSATLSIEGVEKASWEAPSYDEVYNAYESGQKIEWKEVLSRAETVEAEGKEMLLTVNRCCHNEADAKNAGFDNCAKEIEQKITFTLKIE
ncbi:MAG: VWA domain-containing protein [Oligoflexales bacterium]